MRQTQIFSGSSHPALVEAICSRLGQQPAKAELGKFSNGETKVQLQTSIRDQDVFIVQSGSSKINDSVIELLIMIDACKGGSAKSITAVLPYFPYCRQSKKKSHRGSITARMIANQLNVAGVNHVITIDLHASQMQGFFHCPVDNLIAEPLIAQWAKMNVPDWKQAVVVSKNPGGTKRVTSLADALKLNFGIIMTDRRRSKSGRTSMNASVILEKRTSQTFNSDESVGAADTQPSTPGRSHATCNSAVSLRQKAAMNGLHRGPGGSSPAAAPEEPKHELAPALSAPSVLRNPYSDSEDDEGDSEAPAHDVITSRLVHGHIVDEDSTPPPSPSNRIVRSPSNESLPDHMTSSILSTASSLRHSLVDHPGLGGSGDAAASSDEEEENLKNPDFESTVTLVGNVKDKSVFIVDDMIDKSTSWIAAAETVVKRGGATGVYCMATHGLFGGDCLREMEECECIRGVIVTNSFPIPREKSQGISKLSVLDVSMLLSEAIRRNHHGESISQLFMHYD